MSIQRNMPVGVDDFKKLRKSYYFVDKTAFIRELIDNHSEATLITRPRRFGKSLAMSMLYYFFTNDHAEENRALFEDCAIAESGRRYMEEQGSRPVILLSLKDVKAFDYEDMTGLLAGTMRSLYEKFRYLMDGGCLSEEEKKLFRKVLSQEASSADLQMSLRQLTKHLCRCHGRQTLLLIDEYDAPVQSAWEHGYYDRAILFMRNFLSAALKSNTALDFAVLTGVLRVAKESIFSSLNNLEVSSVAQGRFPSAMGFTRSEVERMAKDLGYAEKLSEIREWYDGYSFSGIEIYNPWSVINYFQQDCQPNIYWLNTSGNAIIGEMMKHLADEDEEELLSLLQGKPVNAMLDEGVIYTEIHGDRDALYTVLLTTGYLKSVSTKLQEGMTFSALAIPNREVQTVYRREILNRYRGKMAQSALQMVLEHLTEGRAEEFAKGLEWYMKQIASFHDTAQRESFYHGFMLGITAWLMPRYQVKSNGESGDGRFDVAAFPKEKGLHGIVLEFKVARAEEELATKAREALRQIEEKNYLAEFRSRDVDEVWKYGIAFCGKRVWMEKG